MATTLSDTAKLLITIGANAAVLLVGGAVAWGQNKQSVAAIQADSVKTQAELKTVAEGQTALGTRITILEKDRTSADARMDQMARDLANLHDNVLILCKTSPQRDRCKD